MIQELFYLFVSPPWPQSCLKYWSLVLLFLQFPRSSMKYWLLVTFPRAKHFGRTSLSFPEIVWSGAFWLTMQVFFKLRKCTTLPWQVFTLHCSVAAFHDWLLGVSSWTSNPSPISLLKNCGAHAIKIMIIIIIMVMIKISDKINQCYIVIKASSMQIKWIPKKH